MANRKLQVLNILSSNDAEAVKQFISLLQSNLFDEIVQVRLFGSKIRGTDHNDSDIDVLVLVKSDDYKIRWAVQTLAAQVSLDYDVIIGTFVLSEEQWKMRIGMPLYQAVEAEGVTVS